ncbi:hypothetical protein PGT21_004877 [Puccinia graminis f. sp. tritici]|uniref:Uncharacterized protein n=1 Tax=Puccinia graminis f. sp. tritici TaxID=56615 RepID=A0A5B0LMM8_PUCGR|nr:hypothetical protein PGT21_004877 [Puccinia graminis f. sp. tritici]
MDLPSSDWTTPTGHLRFTSWFPRHGPDLGVLPSLRYASTKPVSAMIKCAIIFKVYCPNKSKTTKKVTWVAIQSPKKLTYDFNSGDVDWPAFKAAVTHHCSAATAFKSLPRIFEDGL